MTENNEDRPEEQNAGGPEAASTDQSAAETANEPSEKIQALKEKAADAFRNGAEEAREAFDRSFPKAKDDFAKGVNDASYAIGYAVSFGTALIKEFTPENVTEGFERGSQAGTKAADEVIAHRRAKDSTPPEEDGDPSPA